MFALFGFFVTLTAWGIIDAFLHSAITDHMNTVMESVRQSGLGLQACLNFPDASTQMLGHFGLVRGGGFMMASALVMVLFKFGSHALASAIGNMQSAMQSAGGQAGSLTTPEGTANFLRSAASAGAAIDVANNTSFSQRVRGESATSQSSIGKGVGSLNLADATGVSALQQGMNAGQTGSVKPGMTGTLGADGSIMYQASKFGSGAFTGQTAKGVEQRISTRLSEAQRVTEGAATRLSSSISETDSARQGAQHAWGNSRGISSSDRESVNRGLRSANEQRENLISTVATNHQLSSEQARQVVSAFEAGVGAGTPGGAGSIFSARAGFNVSAQDQKKMSEVYSTLEKNQTDFVRGYTKTEEASWGRAKEFMERSSSDNRVEAIDAYEHSRARQQSSSHEYSQAYSHEQSLSRAAEHIKKEGASFGMATDALLYNEVGADTIYKANFGDPAAVEAVRAAQERVADRMASGLENLSGHGISTLNPADIDGHIAAGKNSAMARTGNSVVGARDALNIEGAVAPDPRRVTGRPGDGTLRDEYNQHDAQVHQNYTAATNTGKNDLKASYGDIAEKVHDGMAQSKAAAVVGQGVDELSAAGQHALDVMANPYGTLTGGWVNAPGYGPTLLDRGADLSSMLVMPKSSGTTQKDIESGVEKVLTKQEIMKGGN